MSKRIDKGASIIRFPDNYVMIEIETTGLDFSCDIIEIGAIKISNGNIVDKYSTLIKPDPFYLYTEHFEIPHYVGGYITELTGITNEMLETAPDIEYILPSFRDFLSDSIMVGHNIAAFDSNFLYDAYLKYLSEPLKNNYIDTMRLSRWLFPELKHHRLDDLCSFFSVDRDISHRSLDDCMATKICFDHMRDFAISTYGTLNQFYDFVDSRLSQKRIGLKASSITTNNTQFDISNPIYGSVCVFTGALEKMPRREAMQIVKDLGGDVGDSVTKKTTLLILGNNDFCSSIKDGKSNKQKKAEKLRLEGQDIEIISENVFYALAGIE